MNETSNSRSGSRSLLRDRAFVLFAGGQGISALGDAISKTALPLLVLFLTGSGKQMGLVAMLQALPILVLGFPVGVLVDRWDRRRIMLWCDVGRLVCVALIPLAVVLRLNPLWIIYAVAAPIGIFYIFFESACLACVPALVGRERLAEANAYISFANSTGYVVGPAVAGVLAASIGAAYTMGVDALTFAVSTLSLVLIRRPFQQARAPVVGSMMAGIKEGFLFIKRSQLLRGLLAYRAVVSFATEPTLVCVTFYITVDLGLSEKALGSVISLYAIGAVTGAFLGTRIPYRRAAHAMLIGTVIGGLALIALGNVALLWVTLVIAFAAGAGGSLAMVFYVTLRASSTPDHLLGRVISTARVLTLGLNPVSLFCSGLLLDIVGGAITLCLMGGLSLTGSVVYWLSGSLRVAQSQPAEPPE